MIGRKILFVFLFLAFTACEKEQETHTCDDGLLSPGETGVDCGGPCPDCPDPLPTPFAYAKINDTETQFSNYTLEKIDDWILNFNNDTVDVTINLGNGDSLGARPLKVQFAQAQLFGLEYEILSEGTSLFTNIDQENKTLSFFFQAKFTIDPNSPNYNVLDTLYVREGDFENIEWIE
jgi:hypothetical protein